MISVDDRKSRLSGQLFEGLPRITSPFQHGPCGHYLLTPTLVLQIAQTRSYLHILGPKVGTIYILGASGQDAVWTPHFWKPFSATSRPAPASGSHNCVNGQS